MRLALLFLALCSACSGEILGGALPMAPGTPAGSGGGPGPTTGGELGGGPGSGGAAAARPSDGMTLGPHRTALGLRRLTRREYVATVADLLGTTAGTASLTADVPLSHFDNNAHGLSVSLAAAGGLARAAEALSTAAAATVPMPQGCGRDALTPACMRSFLDSWLLRALRRPPTSAEVDRYQALYTSLRATADSREALRGVLEAVLMSSGFLYRTEGVGPDGTLDGYALASRLSYLVWGSMPDDALLSAAAGGGLASAEGRVEQLRRLFRDPKAQDAMVGFAGQWLGAQGVALSRKDASVLQGTGPTLQAELETEFALLVKREWASDSGSLRSFLAGKRTYVGPELARLYGLPAPQSGAAAVSLEGSPRRGALTAGLVIAAHSKESGYSVPLIGHFVRTDVLCQVIPPPPVDAQNQSPPARLPGESYRQTFERFTGAGSACVGCHTFINPPGYAYTSFDAIGRHSDVDSTGTAYDTSARFVELDGKTTEVPDAAALAELIADSRRVQACAARMAMEFAFGRTLHEADLAALDAVASGLSPGRDSLLQLLEALVGSESFARRGPTQ